MSLVSDAAGDSSGVEVVVSSDNAVGGWLSVVGDTLMCGAGVAQNDRGDTEEVVEPGVDQPGWVDGLMCTGSSLRPKRTPMHTMFASYFIAMSCYSGYGDSLGIYVFGSVHIAECCLRDMVIAST